MKGGWAWNKFKYRIRGKRFGERFYKIYLRFSGSKRPKGSVKTTKNRIDFSWNKKSASLRISPKQRICNITLYTPNHHYSPLDIGGLFYQCLLNLAIIYFNGIFIHAAAIKIGTRCFVLLGKANAGKTTLSRLCFQRYGANSVLCDETILLRKKNNKLLICGTPWVGGKSIKEASKLSSNIIIEEKNRSGITFLSLYKSKSKNRIGPLNEQKEANILLNSINHIIYRCPINVKKIAVNRLFRFFGHKHIHKFDFKKDASSIKYLKDHID